MSDLSFSKNLVKPCYLRRGLAQICPFPKMRNLISLGGPQQGVSQYPRCEKVFGKQRCQRLKFQLNLKAYR